MIRTAAWLGSRLPVNMAHGLAVVGGNLEWAVRRHKRATLSVNLGHAIGSPSEAVAVRRLVRREFVNEARRSADLLWAIGRPGELTATTEVFGAEYATEASSRSRGVILAGLHVGGWELAAALPATLLDVPTSVIVGDDWLAWAMQDVRTSVGLRVIYRTAPALAAARVLARGEALLVFGDDAWGARPRCHTVRFCDSYAELPAGIVSLARLSGAVIVTYSVLPVGPRRWHATIEAPIEPPLPGGGDEAERLVLQQLADRWSALVHANPQHWAASFPIAWRDDR